jgi:hypothetical protein
MKSPLKMPSLLGETTLAPSQPLSPAGKSTTKMTDALIMDGFYPQTSSPQ